MDYEKPVCVTCNSSDNVHNVFVFDERGLPKKTHWWHCANCDGEAWYYHYCWSCGEIVDSRVASRCQQCHWFKCPQCGNCADYCRAGPEEVA